MRFRITTSTAPILDPGWLFLAAGVIIMGATIVIPAQDNLAEARWQRERALTQERRRQERIENYERYLKALDAGDEQLALSLAATELNLIPEDREPLPGMPRGQADSATIFSALEPPPIHWNERPVPDSILYRWTTDDRRRLWLIAGGALACLLGLLPPARPRDRSERAHSGDAKGQAGRVSDAGGSSPGGGASRSSGGRLSRSLLPTKNPA